MSEFHWLKRVLPLTLLLVGAPAQAQAQAQVQAPVQSAASPPRPAIWLIEDEDTKIYLFGTVHVFPASLRWRSAALNRVIAEADELVMETPDVGPPTPEMARRLSAPMQLGKSIPILERVSARARGPLQAALEATGMPITYFDQMATWGVAFMLTSMQIGANASGGVEEISGAEEVLGVLFRKASKRVSGVESLDQQIGFFATMPFDAQRRFLESVVLGNPDAAQQEPTDDSWVRGDVEAIAAEMRTLSPELYQVLLTRRNRAWTGWLARRMAQPGVVLFAVGAGHLAGPDSVQRMLAAEGIQARRVD